jgi:type II secretory pathway component GspD/PulD (secretin)
MDAHVEIRVRNASVARFLDSLSAQARVNFILADGLDKQEVTAFLRGVTVREALDILRETRGIAYRQVAPGTYLMAPEGSPQLEHPVVVEGGAGMDRRVTIRLKDAPLGQFLDVLSEQANINFVLDESLKDRRVTTFLTNVTAREALEIVLSTKDLSCRLLEGRDVRRIGLRQ